MGCWGKIFKYSNIRHRILDIRIGILNFLVTNIFDICIRPFSKNKYIRYSQSVLLRTTNIFDIRIRSCCKQRIYLIFVFGPQSDYEYIRYLYSVKSFINMFLIIDRQQKTLGACINMHQNLFKIYFMVEGGHQKFEFYIFNIRIQPSFYE